jgi:GNAT superfamily N-acetyltransferase
MHPVGQFEIRPARPADIPEVRRMLEEYVAWIGLDLAFQEINAELEGLPGDYTPPRGALFVAEDRDLPAETRHVTERLLGTIGLRPFDGSVCEMKRLFVRPGARGRGVAKQLIAVALAEARRLRYSEMRLDTLPMMGDAQSLYTSLGFHDIEPYYETPIAGTRFMSRKL